MYIYIYIYTYRERYPFIWGEIHPSEIRTCSGPHPKFPNPCFLDQAYPQSYPDFFFKGIRFSKAVINILNALSK